MEGLNLELSGRVQDFLKAQPAEAAESEQEVQGADAVLGAQLVVEAQGDRDDVAFDAAGAELEAIEEEPPEGAVPEPT